jgi:6-phosphogluconolactonase
MAPFRWNEYASSQELAEALADTVAEKLRQAIAARGQALIAVSGGTTPGLFLRTLSTRALEWAKVTVTLADERFLPESSPRSNAGLVAANLLQNEAKAARFAGLYRPAETVEAAAKQAEAQLRDFPWPLDVAVLGMGLDGHTASFFPDAPNLEALLRPSTDAIVLPVHSAAAGEPRLTLSLPRLAGSGLVALHIEGNEKRSALEAAVAPESERPVRSVFNHSRRPVEVFWAQ